MPAEMKSESRHSASILFTSFHVMFKWLFAPLLDALNFELFVAQLERVNRKINAINERIWFLLLD